MGKNWIISAVEGKETWKKVRERGKHRGLNKESTAPKAIGWDNEISLSLCNQLGLKTGYLNVGQWCVWLGYSSEGIAPLLQRSQTNNLGRTMEYIRERWHSRECLSRD